MSGRAYSSIIQILNVDNSDLSDAAFRQFIRNSLPVALSDWKSEVEEFPSFGIDDPPTPSTKEMGLLLHSVVLMTAHGLVQFTGEQVSNLYDALVKEADYKKANLVQSVWWALCHTAKELDKPVGPTDPLPPSAYDPRVYTPMPFAWKKAGD